MKEISAKFDVGKAAGVYSALRRIRPRSRADLRNYVKVFLDIDVPNKSVCGEHNAPMDYLAHCFFADYSKAGKPNGDAVVWANRAGGKTELAAVATLLDCVFKPSCQVQILGGSLEQSSRMYEYLVEFIHKGFEGMLAGAIRNRKCRFVNSSSVGVLTQSATSIRGGHIHKLRCDEVELFDEQVFAAAQFVTQSSDDIVGAMEMISTMHRPYGLMHKIVSAAHKNNTAMFKWCVWEVIERCAGRSCSRCPLAADCGGKAKQADGYLKIDDCITQMRRSSRAGFEAEMLCKRPSLENVVFADFDPDVHVWPVDYDSNLPLYRTLDFGFVNPFVCLWVQVDKDGCVRVINEYVRSRATIETHAEEISRLTPGGDEKVTATFCDPAGAGVNDVTGTSVVRELRSLGIRTRYRRSRILEGVELIRRALRDGAGNSRLVISPRCNRLIEALQCYHYPDSNSSAAGELPLKDGLYDHPIDALRYFFVNYVGGAKASSRRY